MVKKRTFKRANLEEAAPDLSAVRGNLDRPNPASNDEAIYIQVRTTGSVKKRFLHAKIEGGFKTNADFLSALLDEWAKKGGIIRG